MNSLLGPFVAAAAALAVVLGIAAAVGDGPWTGGRVPPPFVWRDIAIVHLLSAAPLAILTAIALVRWLPLPAAIAVGLLASAAIGILPLSSDLRDTVESAGQSVPYGRAVLRALCAFGLALPPALVWAMALRQRPVPARSPERGSAALGFAVGVAVLILVPAVYVGARCRHDAARLGDYLGQYRFGEAKVVAEGLTRLDPDREWNGRPLAEVYKEVDGIVAELESRVAQPQSRLATPQERYTRARALAMLGRTDAAIDALRPVRGPQADLLRGSIHETREEWQPALDAYQSARKTLELEPPAPERQAAIAGAVKGAAYSLRKMGRYTEAEAAYREMLELTPTADSHFLLAQFYEDAQQAGKAQEHARRAIALAPERYGRDGQTLIQKLRVYHFGCLNISASK